MAVDFSLLGGARIPMSAQAPKIDYAGNVEKSNVLAGQKIDLEQKRQSVARQENDRMASDAALREDNVDLVTPKGVENFLGRVKGKVSSDTYMGYVDHAEKVKKMHADTDAALSKLGAQQLSAYTQAVEPMVTELQAADDEHTKMTQEKGQIAADEQLKRRTAALALRYKDLKGPTGIPLVPPQLLADVENAPIHLIHGWIANSATFDNQLKQKKDVAETELKVQQAARQAAEAKAIGGDLGKGAEEYTSPSTGKTYFVNKNTKQTYEQNPQTQELSLSQSVPADLVKRGAKTAASGSVLSAAIDEQQDFDKHPPSESELFQARKFILDNKMPSMGAGAAVAPKRLRFLALAAKESQEMGLDPEHTVQLQKKVAAAQEGTKRLMSQNAQIKAGETNVAGALTILRDEVEKLGGANSPLVKKFWNKASTEWAGAPEFVGIAQAYKDVLESSARVYSGVTGAGGTPVSFLQLAEKDVPPNPSLSQVMKLQEVMPRLFKVREAATEQEIENLLKTATLPPKKEGASSDRKVSDKDQAERDKDATAVLRREYSEKLATFKDKKSTPEQRARARQDVMDVRKELKRSGVDVPEPGTELPATDGWTEKTIGGMKVRVRVKPGEEK
jgi:hypothetical protein